MLRQLHSQRHVFPPPQLTFVHHSEEVIQNQGSESSMPSFLPGHLNVNGELGSELGFRKID